MKSLLSIFDYSGVWCAPFKQAGWIVYQWDIKIHELMDINLMKDAETVLDMFGDINGFIAAPPCTEMTVSGNQYWSQKDADGRTEKSKELFRQVFRIADLFMPTDEEYYDDPDNTFFWSFENPVGRLNSLFPFLEKPWYFHPYEFAGYLKPSKSQVKQLNQIRSKNGNKVTEEETNLVIELNCYTKKTGLWGSFNRNLIKSEIEPVKCAPQGSYTQRAGGKSEKTKEYRSNTPLGFAIAFYEANKNYQAPIIHT